MPVATLQTWLGRLSITERDSAITQIQWNGPPSQDKTPLLDEATRQIEAYLAGDLKEFDLPLAPKGGELHQAVFKAMLAIPYGQTRTYGDLAKELDTYGQPIGQACGANPIPIVIPCHRILSANGLGGYSGDGGTETKIALLKLEGGYPFLV
ncbi:methylated-DNA--[protein]-cysteine S-methyltransferase [Roseibium sediminicola]|uniref:Methylated-DNA--[protein]-cysteine S-methyltransferase n=1 Tax=Roseibium sediminicola TaxID=2933272 RepID=A0ABT0GVE5_9HYPH|nr:methylated-DNA--[protein]-cysteine S-methyltransferase [Roseibium sp. CAU 1639]MCK7613047.1 methylated-DNA--[protein]-cysteine S-methyltransferase [Roseibium sp. CAU 1639]